MGPWRVSHDSSLKAKRVRNEIPKVRDTGYVREISNKNQLLAEVFRMFWSVTESM